MSIPNILKKSLVLAPLIAFLPVGGASGNFIIKAFTGVPQLVFGAAELKRSNWNNFNPVFPQIDLYTRDQIRKNPRTNRLPKVLCAWNDLKPVDAAITIKQLCPRAKMGDGPREPEPPSRSGTDNTLPYLIYPRSTKISSQRPSFKWNAVPGATEYEVKLWYPADPEDRDYYWQVTTDLTEMEYPEDEEDLPVGSRYWLIVTANTGKDKSSDKEESGKVNENAFQESGFMVADPGELSQLEAQIDSLPQGIGELEQITVRAGLLEQSGWRYRAIKLLEAQIEAGDASTEQLISLGGLYEQIGLNQIAEGYYRQAWSQLEESEEMMQKAELQASIAQTTFWLTGGQQGREVAIGWLEQARDTYERLGESKMVQEMDKSISLFGGIEDGE